MKRTGQNVSTAVMQRRVEPPDSLDYFPTPPWATRALCEYVAPPIAGSPVWDPACGGGHMVRPLGEYALAVAASDVHDYGWGHVLHDFTMPFAPDGIAGTGWVVTNPPFRLAERFVRRGIEVAEYGVAMLVRSAFVESVGRYRDLFSRHRPALIAQFAERVILSKGRLLDPNKLYWDPVKKKFKRPSTATAYCWIVWGCEPAAATRFEWIPPCRVQLERPGDYDA